MLNRLFSVFLVFLLLSSNFSIVFAAENANLQANSSSGNVSANATASAGTGFSCRNSSLTPKEAQAIFDNVLNKGFIGAEINSGTKPNTDRDNLDQNVLIVPQNGKEAIKAEFPSQKIKPNEVSYLLNNHYSGPFAFGVVLSDSLRVGRCENLPDANRCALTGKNLYYRNSAQGISGDFKVVWDDFKQIFVKKPAELTDAEYENLQAKFTRETGQDPQELKKVDLNSPASSIKDINQANILQGIKQDVSNLKYAMWQRIQDRPIENSILTSYFNVNSQTNCSNNACIISTYSMFDKVFNSWFSANMVLSNFGPTLWGQATKLIGGSQRWGWPWSSKLSELGNKWRKALLTNRADIDIKYDSLFGSLWQKRINMRKDAYGLGDFWKPLMENEGGWDGGFLFHQTAPFRKWWTTEAANPGGILDKLTDGGKNKEVAKQLYSMARDLRQYAYLNNYLFDEGRDAFNAAYKAAGYTMDTAAQTKLLDWARRNARMIQNNDNMFSLDTAEWFSRYQYNGLYDVGVKHLGTGTIVPLHGDSHHIDNIMEKFINDGTFDNWKQFMSDIPGGKVPYPGNAYETAIAKDAAGNIIMDAAGKPVQGVQLYKIGATNELKEVPITELEKNLSLYKDRVAVIETGEKIPLNQSSLNWIKNQGAGTVKISDGTWSPSGELNPLDFAQKLTHSRIKNRVFNTAQGNTTRMVDTMAERNFPGRQFTSWLDKIMSEEDKLLRNYFSLKGGAKWTALPYGYWWMKNGLGFENISGYMLPDTWTQLTTYLGDDVVFDDAFVDFFANEGSDKGDIFVQILNKLPWELVLNQLAQQYKPVENIYNTLTGRQLRTKVENLAMYTTTENECADCRVVINSNNMTQFSPAFNAGNKLTNYVLEDTVSDEAKKKGSTLISFAHHMNLKGKSGDVEGQSIDLPTAKKDKTTCMDKLKKLNLGWGTVNLEKLGDPTRIGLVLGMTEGLSYAVFGWGGIFASAYQQAIIAPQFQDCVDYEEGYFVQLFVPSKEAKKTTEKPQEMSTEKVATLINDSSKKVLDSLKGDGNSFIGKQADDVKKQIENLTQNNQKEVVEAIIETESRTTGNITGEELFYFWFKGNSSASKYRTTGKKNIVDSKSKVSVQIDYDNGKIFANGKEIVSNPDIVRLTSTNADIPAEEIPQNITIIGLSGEDKPLFEMNLNGELFVRDSSVLHCLQDGAKAQTGVGFSSNNLSEVFGTVDAIITDSHPNIFARQSDQSIIAEGTPREIAKGANAKAIIKSNRKTSIKNGSEKKVGLLESIQFKNGTIVYKAETNELIVWLRHNEKAVLSQNDVSGLKALKTDIRNPETDCLEPAINLQAVSISGSDLSASRVKNFNNSIQKFGPFQIIDTPTKRFILYDKFENDACQPYFKVIDKATGDVLTDQPIENIRQTAKGIEITTRDGKTHTLDFAADNGIPTVSYNNGPPETLVSAQGKNGSFYFNPDTGQWFAENAQLLPLLEAFKQKGVSTQANPDGSVSSKPGINITNTNLGGNTNMPFNLPSLPENVFQLVLFICTAFVAIAIIRVRLAGKN